MKGDSHSVSGMVFDVQHFSLDDGPGIRTSVFLKGCALCCLWCHNPEGLNKHSEILYYGENCVQCGRCVSVCPRHCHEIKDGRHLFHREACTACGLCAQNCRVNALRQAGKRMTVDEILSELACDRPFYGADGGITITGGDPLMQPAFTLALLKAAKEQGIHTCMETSGYGAKEALLDTVPYTDLYLYDLKETDEQRHKAYTGGELSVVLDNLAALTSAHAPVILRCPLIENCNLREEHATALARIANSSPSVQAIHIEPYHPLGISKYQALERECGYACTDGLRREVAEEFCAILRNHTAVPVLLL